MANVKVKRMAGLQAILNSAEEETGELLKPVVRASEEEIKAIEDQDIGASENKSGRGMGWYVIHTYSGYEKKVKLNIEKAIENRHLEDKILEIRVPMQDVMEVKSTGKKKTQKKVLPGYVLIHMDADDNDAWYVVRNTRGVTGFVGPGSKPVPLEDYDMGTLEQERIAKIDFAIDDTIMVIDGPWKDTVGKVTKIDENKQTATIMVEMFGRETPVEIGFGQVKKLD
jgi:transcriptional antiterminator NusG